MNGEDTYVFPLLIILVDIVPLDGCSRAGDGNNGEELENEVLKTHDD